MAAPATQDLGSTDEDEPSPAPAGPAPWGTLVSLSSHPPLDLTGAAHTLGRGAACSLVLSQSFISTTHARLLRDGGDGAPAVEDTSTNGVWLNGQKVGKGNSRPLRHADALSLAKPDAAEAAQLRFLFTAPSAAAAAAAAPSAAAASSSQGDAETPPMAGDDDDGGGGSQPPAEPAAAAAGSSGAGAAAAAAVTDDDDAAEKHFTCAICQDIVYRPVAVQPCLHSFCGGCYAEWMRMRRFDCPECRQRVQFVSRNHGLKSLVDDFLAKHPAKARDAAERARLDEIDTLGNEPRRVGKRARGDGGDDDDDLDDDDDGSGSELGSGEESESDDGGVALLQNMQQIIAAGGALPAGIPPWLAAQAAAAFATEACECCTRRYPQAAVRSLAERRPPIVPTVNGFAAPGLPNAHERQILVDFLAAQGLDAAALLRECLRRVEAGVLTLAHPSFPARALTPATRLCEGCATTIFATLAYAYRAAIPQAQLPPAVTARSNCWYGRQCRTQRHNAAHAERLNHVCEADPSHGRRGGGGGGGGGGGAGAAGSAAGGAVGA